MKGIASKIKVQLQKLIGRLKINVGTIDRIVRIAVGVIVILIALTGAPWGRWGYWLGPLFILSGILSFCPIYAWLGKSTYKPDED